MTTEPVWSTIYVAPSIRRERPSTGVPVLWDYAQTGRQVKVEVRPERTIVLGDPTSFLEFGYQSANQKLTSTEGVAGKIAGQTSILQQAKGLGITRKSSRVFLRSGSSEWYWQKTGFLKRVGTAHSCFRANGTEIARTRGLRNLEIHRTATDFEVVLVALSYASSATEECARGGLSSLFWF